MLGKLVCHGMPQVLASGVEALHRASGYSTAMQLPSLHDNLNIEASLNDLDHFPRICSLLVYELAMNVVSVEVAPILLHLRPGRPAQLTRLEKTSQFWRWPSAERKPYPCVSSLGLA